MPPSAHAQLQALLRNNPQLKVVEPPSGRVTPRAPAARTATGRGPDTLEGLLQRIQDLAAMHGWTGQHTQLHGGDTGLHIILVRDVVLFVEVLAAGTTLSPSQQRWITALRQTGQVEVAVWTETDLPQITERLGRARRTP